MVKWPGTVVTQLSVLSGVPRHALGRGASQCFRFRSQSDVKIYEQDSTPAFVKSD